MKRCPITYQPISDHENYSLDGIRKVSNRLTNLKIFPYNAFEQRQQATEYADKLSIQGLQPKLSAKLNVKKEIFEITAKGGKYILKPPSEHWKQLPENEDVSMKMAEMVDIEVPFHGLIICEDKTYTYFIKRMDRFGHKEKRHLEDFSQLAGKTRDTKYDYSTEKVADIVQKYCTFPILDKKKLFVRTLFNYLIGNEDMHLKNFSLIIRDQKIELSPAYDLLNSTIVLKNAMEEIALPIRGKKRNLTKKDLLTYFPKERLGLNQKILDQIIDQFKNAFEKWQNLIEICFLSDHLKDQYWRLICERRRWLQI